MTLATFDDPDVLFDDPNFSFDGFTLILGLLEHSEQTRHAAASAIAALLDNGYLRLYDSDRPLTADDPTTGILLAELRFGDPAFASPFGGIVLANPITSGNGALTGTATWFRALAEDGTPILDGSVGAEDSTLILPTPAIQQGARVDVESMTIGWPSPPFTHTGIGDYQCPAAFFEGTGTAPEPVASLGFGVFHAPPAEYESSGTHSVPVPAGDIFGFGASTTGGEGGATHNVDTVAELRTALAASGTRIVKFTTGGDYDLGGSDITVTNGNLTIDASDAPTPVIWHNGMLMIRANNVLARQVRFRATGPDLNPGDGDTDAMTVGIYNGSTRYSNIVFDHCEFLWGPDVCATALGGITDATFQYCIFGEGLFASVHPQSFGGPDGDPDGHGLGFNLAAKHEAGHERITIYSCLITTNQSRNPRLQNCRTTDIINCVIYNHHEGPQGAVHGLNMINNYYKEGPAPAAAGLSTPNRLQWRTQVGSEMPNAPAGSVYLSGNHAANFAFASQSGSDGTVIAGSPRHTPSISGADLRTATDAYVHVLANVGPRLPSIETHTQRILDNVADGDGEYRDGYIWASGTHHYPPVEHS